MLTACEGNALWCQQKGVCGHSVFTSEGVQWKRSTLCKHWFFLKLFSPHKGSCTGEARSTGGRRRRRCFAGCGGGQYLEAGGLGALGCERSGALARVAASCGGGGHQVVLGDALALPFRDEALDAALSVAVLHHLASTERRVQALRELARVLRVGGRVLITVWAMEQTQRKASLRG
ncbi:hypothetical protein HPB48_018397 [Haemaphysalis longicornis]|uniref:Methyltransferase type 11 domain-containing protein n=1 Tax=Haemaphysalis longicornis TaxID=44386 RepID=A0A9J6GFV1_HAELO|nr:hypothetical protein HPB48_018397 [Haemaphysalis longicornis]